MLNSAETNLPLILTKENIAFVARLIQELDRHHTLPYLIDWPSFWSIILRNCNFVGFKSEDKKLLGDLGIGGNTR
jgi:hypothetical protein